MPFVEASTGFLGSAMFKRVMPAAAQDGAQACEHELLRLLQLIDGDNERAASVWVKQVLVLAMMSLEDNAHWRIMHWRYALEGNALEDNAMAVRFSRYANLFAATEGLPVLLESTTATVFVSSS